jgi:dihydropyrimidinase
MPGGIDPHTHMELPFMGTVASEDFFTGTSAAAAGGTTMIIDFVIPNPQQRILDAYRSGAAGPRRPRDYSLPRRHHLVGREVRRHGTLCAEHGVNSFKHFMAYKNAIMCDDEVLVNSFPARRELGALCTVHAENGELVYRLQQEIFDRGFRGPEGTRSRGRPRSRARRPTARSASPRCSGCRCTWCTPPASTRSRPSRGPAWRGSACSARCSRSTSSSTTRVYRNPDWNAAAHYVMSPPFRSKEHQAALWRGLQAGMLQTTPPTTAASARRRSRPAWTTSARSPTGRAGSRTAWRCCGTTGCARAG